jgi:23S rRNA pseudouridine2605 synthase
MAPGLIRLTIHEGRNRQVRRMCEAIGHPVLRLARSRIGPLADPNLRPGEWRPLETSELLALQRAVTLPPSGSADPSVDGPPSRPPDTT